MSTFAIVALVVLAVLATVLVVAAAVRLGRASRPAPGRNAAAQHKRPSWYEILLAVVLVLALVILAIASTVEILSGGDAASSEDWRGQTRSTLFLGVMLALAALSLLFLVVFLVARTTAAGGAAVSGGEGAAAEAAETVRDPAASRLLGLLLLAVGLLLLGWVYPSPTVRADLMAGVLYPAAIAVGIVLLFDKATRGWTPKTRTEGYREWLLCDVILITLVLGFLNVDQLESRDAYGGFFWDMVHIAGFFLVFWCLDRTSMRGRFLVGFGYLALLPLLLLLWRWVQEIEAPADPAWWSTVWPVFVLALVFFVLEIVALLVARDGRAHMVPAIKDTLFVVLYATFLIVAAPSA